MIEVIVVLLILFGTVMNLLSTYGLIRLPDIYNRAHASTKSATLGILSILLAAFIYFMNFHGVSSIRLLLAIAFVFLTAPLSGHMIIRSAHRYGVPLAPISVKDELKALEEKAKIIEDDVVRPVEAES